MIITLFRTANDTLCFRVGDAGVDTKPIESGDTLELQFSPLREGRSTMRYKLERCPLCDERFMVDRHGRPYQKHYCRVYFVKKFSADKREGREIRATSPAKAIEKFVKYEDTWPTTEVIVVVDEKQYFEVNLSVDIEEYDHSDV